MKNNKTSKRIVAFFTALTMVMSTSSTTVVAMQAAASDETSSMTENDSSQTNSETDSSSETGSEITAESINNYSQSPATSWSGVTFSAAQDSEALENLSAQLNGSNINMSEEQSVAAGDTLSFTVNNSDEKSIKKITVTYADGTTTTQYTKQKAKSIDNFSENNGTVSYTVDENGVSNVEIDVVNVYTVKTIRHYANTETDEVVTDKADAGSTYSVDTSVNEKVAGFYRTGVVSIGKTDDKGEMTFSAVNADDYVIKGDTTYKVEYAKKIYSSTNSVITSFTKPEDAATEEEKNVTEPSVKSDAAGNKTTIIPEQVLDSDNNVTGVNMKVTTAPAKDFMLYSLRIVKGEKVVESWTYAEQDNDGKEAAKGILEFTDGLDNFEDEEKISVVANYVAVGYSIDFDNKILSGYSCGESVTHAFHLIDDNGKYLSQITIDPEKQKINSFESLPDENIYKSPVKVGNYSYDNYDAQGNKLDSEDMTVFVSGTAPEGFTDTSESDVPKAYFTVKNLLDNVKVSTEYKECSYGDGSALAIDNAEDGTVTKSSDGKISINVLKNDNSVSPFISIKSNGKFYVTYTYTENGETKKGSTLVDDGKINVNQSMTLTGVYNVSDMSKNLLPEAGVKVTFTDNNGYEYSGEYVNAKADTINGVITVADNCPGINTSKPVQLCNSKGDVVAECSCKIDETNNSKYIVTISKTKDNKAVFETEGITNYKIRAEKNTTGDVVEIDASINVDTIAPEFNNIDLVYDGKTYNKVTYVSGTIKVSFKVSDAGDSSSKVNAESVKMKVGDDYVDLKLENDVYTATIETTDNIAKEILFIAEDNAGNTYEYSNGEFKIVNNEVSVDSVAISSTADGLVWNMLGFGNFFNNSFVATIKVNSPNDVASVWCSFDEASVNFTEAKVNDDGSYSFKVVTDVLSPKNDGILTIKVVGKTGQSKEYKLENIGDYKNSIVMIDMGKPTVEFDVPTAVFTSKDKKDWYKAAPTINVKATDTLSGLNVFSTSLNGGNNQEVQYTVDEKYNKSAVTDTQTLSYTDKAQEGENIVVANATDNAGNIADKAEKKVYVDTKAPVISDVSFTEIKTTEKNVMYANKTVKVSVNVTDEGSGVKSVKMYVGEDSTDYVEMKLENGVYTATIETTDDKKESISFEAEDNVGNKSTTESESSLMIETSSPVISDITFDYNLKDGKTINGVMYTQGAVKVSVNVTDAGSGVNAESVKMYVDETEYTMTLNDGVYTATIETTNKKAESISFAAEDKAGNSVKQESSSLCIDTTAPEISEPSFVLIDQSDDKKIYTENGVMYASGAVEVSVKVTDAGSGVNAKTVKIKVGEKYYDMTPAGDVYTATIENTNEAAKSISFVAEDNIGNSVEQESASLYIDTKAPVISEPSFVLIDHSDDKKINIENGVMYASRTVIASVKVTDAGSGVNAKTVKIKVGEKYYDMTSVGDVYTATIENTNEVTESISFIAGDNVGNKTDEIKPSDINKNAADSLRIIEREVSVESLTISSTPEGFVWNMLGFGNFFNNSFVVTVKSNYPDDVKSVWYSFNETSDDNFKGATVNDDGSYSFVVTKDVLLGNGNDLLTLKVIDKADTSKKQELENIKPFKNSMIMIDMTAPIVEFDVPTAVFTSTDNKDWYKTKPTINVKATDKLSGLNVFSTSLNGENIKEVKYTEDEKYNKSAVTETQTISYTEEEQEGENTVVANATDNAGNIAEVAEKTVYVDATVPEVTNVEIRGLNSTYENGLSHGMYANGNVTVSVNASDAGSGVKFVKMYVDEKEYVMISDNDDGIYTATIEDTNNNREKISFVVEDNVGNSVTKAPTVVNNNIKSDFLMIETEKPIMEFKIDEPIRTIGGKAWYNSTTTIKVNATDKLSGLDVFSTSLNGGNINEVNYNKPDNKESAVTAPQTISYSTEEKEGKNTVVANATDNAGNAADKAEKTFYVDTKAPKFTEAVISCDVLNKYFINDSDCIYVPKKVTVSVKVTDVIDGIEGSGVKSVTMKVGDKDYVMTPNGDGYTATIDTTDNTARAISFVATDNVNNGTGKIDLNVINNSYQSSNLMIDTESPESVTLNVSGLINRNDIVFDSIGQAIFDMWSNSLAQIVVSSSDKGSKVGRTEYFISYDKSMVNTINESDWQEYTDKIYIRPNTKAIIYARAIDRVGNVSEIHSTNGIIVDDRFPSESVNPIVTTTPVQPINGFYNGDAQVLVEVTDPEINGASSGLNRISYVVLADNKQTASGVLYQYNEQNPSYDNLLRSWSGTITIPAALNNTNDVKVKIVAIDNANNVADESNTSGAVCNLSIDVTAPVIDVSMNGTNDSAYTSYFRTDRTATITITERNFDSKDVVITMTKDGRTFTPAISSWTHNMNVAEPDKSTHTATIKLDADGDYTFGIDYTDLAGNRASRTTYAEGVIDTSFTIDKTLPEISVAYDNNSVLNEKYYKAQRQGTITVKEHNFDANRINAVITCDGKAVKLGTWKNDGDVHTITFDCKDDGNYSVDVSANDMAGNAQKTKYTEKFVIDTVNPDVEIKNLTDKKAYSKQEQIKPVVDFSDDNFDKTGYSVEYTVKKMENVGDAQSNPTEVFSDDDTGVTVSYSTLEQVQDNDGLYTMTAKITDLAGNSSEETVTFSVNCYGSIFAIEDNPTLDICGKMTNQEVDVRIVEYNVEQPETQTATIAANSDVKDVDNLNITDESGKDTNWYRGVYVIPADNFTYDGIYEVTVKSTDTAGNVVTNSDNMTNSQAAVKFVLDKTKPEVSITGVENDGIYEDASRKVSIICNDANIDKDSLNIIVNGKEITDYSVEPGSASQLEVSLTVSASGSNDKQSVEVKINDLAGNESEPAQVSSFILSAGLLTRLVANTPLFIGLIILVVVVGTGIVLIILKKRRN